MINDKEIERMINNMVLSGYLEIDGIDGESGEFLYKPSPRLYEEIPDLQERLESAFIVEVYNLWAKEMIDMDTTKESPIISLNINAFDDKKVSELTLEERHTLFIVMQALKKEG